ncbi:hypothetical protein PIIN_02228 [Serendipita indica DSM 11827]|uniref:Uncharacterized protein n=1 Tax=Serendipita indica (strain DSM 11827) TaxID=1109443 RepID=G4TAP3_SERID|nr:hypothetical protein PIIN_02228 [Serendipita indica DSM 11827]
MLIPRCFVPGGLDDCRDVLLRTNDGTQSNIHSVMKLCSLEEELDEGDEAEELLSLVAVGIPLAALWKVAVNTVMYSEEERLSYVTVNFRSEPSVGRMDLAICNCRPGPPCSHLPLDTNVTLDDLACRNPVAPPIATPSGLLFRPSITGSNNLHHGVKQPKDFSPPRLLKRLHASSNVTTKTQTFNGWTSSAAASVIDCYENLGGQLFIARA